MHSHRKFSVHNILVGNLQKLALLSSQVCMKIGCAYYSLSKFSSQNWQFCFLSRQKLIQFVLYMLFMHCIHCLHCNICLIVYALYTLYSMHCTLCIVFCTLYHMYCIPGILFYALYSIDCIYPLDDVCYFLTISFYLLSFLHSK